MAFVAVFLLMLVVNAAFAEDYFGKKIGSFTTLYHQVSGDVYVVDSKTFHIRNFNYDGDGPDAFFWAGNTAEPSKDGFIVLDEKGTMEVLQPYRNKFITITLPDEKTVKDIKWLSVWCRKFTVDFGNVKIPDDLVPPKPLDLGPIPGVEHGLSSGPVMIVDAQTFMVPNMTLDGLAPDAHFWAGKGKPSPDGTLVPDENGSDKPLGLYDKKSVVITLPDKLTVFDIDYFGVWCKIAASDFGHIKMPKELNVPPSLKMLGQSVKQKLNCEVLNFDPPIEVRWSLSGEMAIIQLVTRIPSGEYISFGLSGHQHQSVMVGGDVTVAWIDRKGVGHAVDYHLESKAQCAGGRGSCPDEKIKANSSHVMLLNAALVEDFTTITYTRPITSNDPLDKSIVKDYPQPVIWAVGPLNSLNEVSYHNTRNFGSQFIVFGRNPSWNCPSFDPNENPFTPPPPSPSLPDPTHPHPRITTPIPTTSVALPPPPSFPTTLFPQELPEEQPEEQTEESTLEGWFIPPIQCNEPTDGVFYAQMGPTGGKRGYTAITGNVGWGIAWFINGLLIPEITVVRGKTYRFVVEGGNDVENPSRNHPFYITDDPEGGYAHKTPEERNKVRVYAGVQEGKDGPYPTGLGRLCQWTPLDFTPAETFHSFGEYQRHLTLRCREGRPGMITWTPDANTPNIVYYQCYTHRYLGWKIHVVDQCDLDIAESIIQETKIPPPAHYKHITHPKPIVVKGGFNSLSLPSRTSIIPVGKQQIHFHHSENSSSIRLQTGFRPIHSQTTNLPPTNPKVEKPKDFDPFTANTSIPFHSRFRPGIPHFGGFRSIANRRRPGPVAIFLPHQIVPSENHNLPVIKDRNSGIGPFIRVNSTESGEILQAESSEQTDVVFRTFGGRNIPPLPPHLKLTSSRRRNPLPPKLKIANLQPVSFDGSPVPNAHFSAAQPLPSDETKRKSPFNIQQTKQYGPFRGQKPPAVPENVPHLPQFDSGSKIKPRVQNSLTTLATETDYNILNNVWSIISSQGGRSQ